ncbi:AAA family ATPase [Nesterenkonia marinintestina]|uniref:AAA family ATPase n=1 Tax=Nesterenkonia marinintestina TaxID=2979865 RepID=UPI0021C1D366|nr:ATP-binding protein [Nesterenkonia sp. GX14115]
MRLVSAHIRGYGRLVDTTIKLDQKLISVVGPNESGTTTLLKSLNFIETNEALELKRWARAGEVNSSTEIVSLRYLLDEDDKESLGDLDLLDSPAEFIAARSADGKLRWRTEPPLSRGTSLLREGYIHLHEALNAISSPIATSPETSELNDIGSSPEGTQLLIELNEYAAALDQYLAAEDPSQENLDWLLKRAQELRDQVVDSAPFAACEAALNKAIVWGEADDPCVEARKRLWSSSPDFALFRDEDRALRSTYTLDRKLLKDLPSALGNLLRLAELDLQALTNADQQQQIAKRETLLRRANRNLNEHFSNVWKQSDLTVELQMDGGLLRINVIEDGEHSSPFAERSQGLRTFVALAAFLAARNTGRPTILLVDEAENHLHIDAQADLIDMFAEQQQAEKIIYTTHSPACLPRDMGVGLRAVVIDGDESSHVENAFWSMDGHGLSPVMFAMGAAAAAFTPARYAVIGEGPSDMMLLPPLIRACVGLERLPYQVAPGLSKAPKSAYPDLDVEAARVAFVIDGDSGGEILAKELSKVFPNERIVRLPFPGIENALDTDAYLTVVSELLAQRNSGIELPKFPELPDRATSSWAKTLEDWAQEADLSFPSKTEVAYRLLELEPTPISESERNALKELHAALVHALKV